MEPLKQVLKIGAGLSAFVAIGILAIPERPTLLSGGEPRAEAPVPFVSEPEAPAADGPETSPPATAQAPAPPAAPTSESTQAAGDIAQPADDVAEPTPAPTPGQLHLQRLREQAGTPAPAEPPAPPAQEEFEAPAEMPPEMDAADIEDQGGGAGLDTLTRPTAPVQFRLLSAPDAADSGTIAAGDQSVRLSGLVPVPAEARCADGTSCGAAARDAVQSWLAGRALLCAIPQDAGESTEAPCLMGEEDVGEWIVGNGWAEAAPGSRYVETEERARAAGRGIWASGGR